MSHHRASPFASLNIGTLGTENVGILVTQMSVPRLLDLGKVHCASADGRLF